MCTLTAWSLGTSWCCLLATALLWLGSLCRSSVAFVVRHREHCKRVRHVVNRLSLKKRCIPRLKLPLVEPMHLMLYQFSHEFCKFFVHPPLYVYPTHQQPRNRCIGTPTSATNLSFKRDGIHVDSTFYIYFFFFKTLFSFQSPNCNLLSAFTRAVQYKQQTRKKAVEAKKKEKPPQRIGWVVRVPYIC